MPDNSKIRAMLDGPPGEGGLVIGNRTIPVHDMRCSILSQQAVEAIKADVPISIPSPQRFTGTFTFTLRRSVADLLDKYADDEEQD